ncbi:MAG: hypothetical protein J0H43_06010, partial [Actinobacteria bacterium]|nr:hypothetical protein [Actinomycetota bacterium]
MSGRGASGRAEGAAVRGGRDADDASEVVTQHGRGTEAAAFGHRVDRVVALLEHPTGEFTVRLEVEDGAGMPIIKRAGLVRTARKLFDGTVFVSSRAASGWSLDA